ncbi:hypothetical protein [Formosa sp. A9]|uniref:hypothetical protein n=1 Tax=Formosa sp. A9 TaxID=3442641 RepID=UPI003EB82F1A
MILISKYFIPRGYLGITLYPFVLLKDEGLKTNKVLMNHERIHLRQQLELLVIPFYVFYCIEFCMRLIQYKHWNLAYRNISFEREAYTNEKDLNYVRQRSWFSFLKYV